MRAVRIDVRVNRMSIESKSIVTVRIKKEGKKEAVAAHSSCLSLVSFSKFSKKKKKKKNKKKKKEIS